MIAFGQIVRRAAIVPGRTILPFSIQITSGSKARTRTGMDALMFSVSM